MASTILALAEALAMDVTHSIAQQAASLSNSSSFCNTEARLSLNSSALPRRVWRWHRLGGAPRDRRSGGGASFYEGFLRPRLGLICLGKEKMAVFVCSPIFAA